VRNRDRVVAALRGAGALAYSELRERSAVPVGSFDRTLAALLDGGTIARADGGYRLDDGEAVRQGKSRTGTGIYAYCARCGGSHPKPDKASGETVADVHNRDVMASQIGG
jgi:hypothetical protein